MIIHLEDATVESLIAVLSKLDGNLPVEVPIEGITDGTRDISIEVTKDSVYISE